MSAPNGGGDPELPEGAAGAANAEPPDDIDESDVADLAAQELRDAAAEHAEGVDLPAGGRPSTEDLVNKISGREDSARTTHTDWPGD